MTWLDGRVGIGLEIKWERHNSKKFFDLAAHTLRWVATQKATSVPSSPLTPHISFVFFFCFIVSVELDQYIVRYKNFHSTFNVYTTRKRRAPLRNGGDDDEGGRRGKLQDLWAGLQWDLRACSFGSAISAHSSSKSTCGFEAITLKSSYIY